MGWGKPTVLGDAKQLAQQLQEFTLECKAQQGKISEAAKKGERVGPLALDEMDATLAKWATIHNTVTQNKEKADILTKNWEKYEISFNDFDNWLSPAELAIQKPLDRKMMTLPQLDNALTQLKGLNKEISNHQSQLIGVTQECDAVVQHLSPEGATALNGNLAQLKTRLQVFCP